jgi:hypothetical protein
MKKMAILVSEVHEKFIKSPDFIILGLILVFCLIYRFYYFGIRHPDLLLYDSDSVTYFASINIFKGITDLYRTPLYPFLLKITESLSKEFFIKIIILIQQFISFLTIIPFYFITKNIIKNRYFIIVTVLYFGCWGFLLQQNANINPESFCVIGSTLLLFLFVCYIKKPTKLLAFSVGFLPLFLIMLKPIYLISLCVVLLFYIFRLIIIKNEKNVLYWGLLGWLMSVIGILGYCEMNNRNYGEFLLSKIPITISLSNIITSETYKKGGDIELINLIDATKQKGVYISVFLLNNELIDNYKRSYINFPQYLLPTDDMIFCSSIPDIENYSIERIRQFVKKSQSSGAYVKFIIIRLLRTVYDYLMLFLILFIESSIFIYGYIKYKKITWIHLFCIIFIFAQLFTIILTSGVFSTNMYASNSDNGRLLLPIYPFSILIISSFLEVVVLSIDKKKFINLFF